MNRTPVEASPTFDVMGRLNTAWIDVNEKLPEQEGIDVLVYWNSNRCEPETGYHVAYLRADCDSPVSWHDPLGGEEILSVTHWMPLPKPPG